jgi:uncharacterized protein YidB (DUF937 family)
MGLLEEIQKQIAASLTQHSASEPEPEAEVAAKPEFQGGLADLIAKGGLSGILEKFKQAGLGDVASSWIGKGDNKPVTADQVHVVFGPAEIAAIAAKLGIQPADISKAMAKVLPSLIDKLTPHGKIEEPAAAPVSAGSTDF